MKWTKYLVFLFLIGYLLIPLYVRADPVVVITVTAWWASVPTVTTDGGATNKTETDARLRGEITNTGDEDPNVNLYWGESDGGTDPGSWSNNSSLGIFELGPFYVDYFGIFTANTTYYYTFEATNSGGTDWPDSSANFTTYPPGTFIYAPTGFDVADLGAITLEFNWTKGVGANYTMIRGSRDIQPTAITEGELIYYGEGESTNSSGYALDITNYKFSAFGFWSDNISHSEEYAIIDIGGEAVDEIADKLGLLEDNLGLLKDVIALFVPYIPQMIALLLLTLMAILTYWHRDKALYMLTGFAFILYSFQYWTSNLYVSIILVFIGVYNIIKLAQRPKKGS